MARTVYLRELQRLQDDLLLLSSMVSYALRQSMLALKHCDCNLASWLIEDDARINVRRYDIEADALALIATQQPVAGDVRFLAGVLEIAGELERIGDYAKGVGRIVAKLPSGSHPVPIGEIPQMCELVLAMLGRALDAFMRQDAALAREIPQADDEVDALYNRFNQKMLSLIRVDSSLVDHANALLWAAHNIERAGDRVTNICERTIYTVTGDFIEVDMRPRAA
jgi:phosphate transport system protein